jgi:hypothetical protein
VLRAVRLEAREREKRGEVGFSLCLFVISVSLRLSLNSLVGHAL